VLAELFVVVAIAVVSGYFAGLYVGVRCFGEK